MISKALSSCAGSHNRSIGPSGAADHQALRSDQVCFGFAGVSAST
jgi:hypothetical protein